MILSGMEEPLDSLISRLDSTKVNPEQVELRLEIASRISNENMRGAVEYASEALFQAEKMGSRVLTAEAKLAIGRYYDYLGVQEEATELLSDARRIFEELGMKSKEASALMLLGNIYWYLGQYESSLRYYDEASSIAETIGDSTLIVRSMISKGAAYGNLNRRDTALVLFESARLLARQTGNQQQELLAYFNMGDVYLYSGRLEDAIGIFYDLEKNYDVEKTNSRILGNLYNSMTTVFLNQRNLPWAIHYSEKTRMALEKYNRLTEERDYYLNRYRLDTLSGDLNAAIADYERYTLLKDSLSNESFANRLLRLEIFFELRAKENEIERLTLDNQYKDLQIRQRMIINYGTTTLVVLLLLIGFLVFRSTIRTRQKNVLLELANDKIRSQSEDLQEKNTKLESVIEELKATQQHLVQSEKMASLGTLTAGIAHEINNPLNFISGGLGIVEESLKLENGSPEKPEKQRQIRAVQLAKDGLDRATGIVQALMTFSHKGSSKKVQSDLHEIIDHTLLFLHSKLDPTIKIHKEYTLGRPLEVYTEKMHQVVMNIIDNAIHAVKQRPEDNRSIWIRTREKGTKALLTISNNGPKIDNLHIGQLFDPFFTTKEPGEGTGLGLSICYTLISDHGGAILAENTEEGVEFRIEIPL
jgi:two-component system NtrC family sensor kinase